MFERPRVWWEGGGERGSCVVCCTIKITSVLYDECTSERGLRRRGRDTKIHSHDGVSVSTTGQPRPWCRGAPVVSPSAAARLPFAFMTSRPTIAPTSLPSTCPVTFASPPGTAPAAPSPRASPATRRGGGAHRGARRAKVERLRLKMRDAKDGGARELWAAEMHPAKSLNITRLPTRPGA